MTLEQLRIFVAVAEALNMTRAAEALNLTQPSVSAAIAALEGRHGLRLFDRIGRGLDLSEAGRAFLPEARTVLAQSRIAAQALDDLSALRRGTLRLVASQTVATYRLPVPMARFAAQWPGVTVTLGVGNSKEAAEAVVAGEADLGFVEGPLDHDLLRIAPIGGDRLGLYARPDHPLAQGARIGAAELVSLAWIMREPGSGTRAHLAEALAHDGVVAESLDVRLELPSNGAVLEALEVGGVVAAVSDLAAATRVVAGRIARLDWSSPPRGFSLLHHRERRLNQAASAFSAMLRAP